MIKYLKLAATMSLICTVGCASNRYVTNKQDPLEPLNRGIYRFNKTVDALYIKPVTKTYDKVLPKELKRLINNFFNNVNEVPTIINSLLQAKFQQASNSTARFVINSTLGIGGLFDVAESNTKRSREDFGKTLATWGYKNSNYLVLPILGPSTVRDGIGVVGNLFFNPPYYFKPKWRNRYQVGYLIDRRSSLQEAEKFIVTAGVDEYIMMRDSYLQHRDYTINGKVKSDAEMLKGPPE